MKEVVAGSGLELLFIKFIGFRTIKSLLDARRRTGYEGIRRIHRQESG